MTFNLLKEMCALRNERIRAENNKEPQENIKKLEIKYYKLKNKYVSEVKRQDFKYLS